MTRNIEKALLPRKKPTTEKERFVIIKLPYIGKMPSRKFEGQIKEAIKPAYSFVKVIVCWTARSSFRQIAKEVLPTTSRSMVVYQYMCSCKLTYVGKTSQKFTERMKQHVPDKLIDGDLTHPKSESAITRHLKDSAECVPSDRADAESRFSIVSSARSKCHLHVLGAVYMYIRSLAPPLCVQKVFVRVLQLF